MMMNFSTWNSNVCKQLITSLPRLWIKTIKYVNTSHSTSRDPGKLVFVTVQYNIRSLGLDRMQAIR